MSRHHRIGKRNYVARTLNDLGLAAWFGGSLMGAVGLNRAADTTESPFAVAEAGWTRWSLVNTAAIAAYTVGSLVVTKDNKGRIAAQSGVASTALVKAALTGSALAATAYARVLGKQVSSAASGGAEVAGATTPSEHTPDDVAAAQRRLKVAQWAVPALTGAMIIADSRLSEQQRPMAVVQGVLHRLNPAA